MSRGSAPGGFEQDCLVGTKAPQHVGSMTGDDDLPANAGQRPELLDEHPEAKQLESNWSVALSPRGSAIRLENSFRQHVNPEEYTGRRRRRGCRLRGRISERPEVAIRDLWVQVSIKCDDFADTSPPVERLRSRKNYISV